MSCAYEYERGFAIDALGKTWFSSVYSPARKALLLEREMQLLPAAAAKLPGYRERRRADAAINAASARVREARKALQAARHELAVTRSRRANMAGVTTQAEDPVQLPCPADGCTGFVSSQWKCGTCDQWVCKHCREVVGFDRHAEHECDPSSLASISAMKSLSKPCPGCKIMTERSEGCSQMYCTRCGCWWNFRTGKKDTSSFRHNPHHAALVATGNEIIHDDDCALGVVSRTQSRQIVSGLVRLWRSLLPRLTATARLHNMEDLITLVGSKHASNIVELFHLAIRPEICESEIVNTITNTRGFRRMYRLLTLPNHIADVTRRLRDIKEDSHVAKEKATEFRLQHILGEITTEQLQRCAWKRHKDSEVATAQIDVLQASHDVIGHILMRIHAVLPDPVASFDYTAVRDTIVPQLLQHLRSIQNTLQYVNNHTNTVKRDFSRAAWGFDINNATLHSSAAVIAPVEGST